MKKLFFIFGILLLGGIVLFILHDNKKDIETDISVDDHYADDVAVENIISEEDLPIVEEIHPDSIDALQQKEFSGNNLTLGRILARTDVYTRYYITYESEGLTISGIMNVPQGKGPARSADAQATAGGPFPVLFLNHGYIDPAVYTNGRGLKREQDYFARNGYVVVHSDYRGHAQSDPDPYRDIRPRTGYTEDVINAAVAVKKSDLTFVDKERFGMLGHSMGGGVTLNVMVAKPDLIKANVLFAPISAHYQDNFERYLLGEDDAIAQTILDTYGSFDTNPEYWKSVSAINYFGDVSAPVMIHHGTADKDVPLSWSQKTHDALESAGKEVIYHEYPGEPHEFATAWPTVMERSVDFFDKHVK